MQQYIDLLHREGCSCVIAYPDGRVITGTKRGVMDLYDLYRADNTALCGVRMADKVVGKGAAALMVLGGISSLYADVISMPALALLEKAGIQVSYGECVEYIINRDRVGRCPLETLCDSETDIYKLWPIIEDFVEGIKRKMHVANVSGL